MKIVILTAVLVLLSEAGLTNTGMSVPQWYTPCSNKERHSQSHRLVKTHAYWVNVCHEPEKHKIHFNIIILLQVVSTNENFKPKPTQT